MALLVGWLVALIVTRRSRLGRRAAGARSTLDGFFMLPLGVCAVTLGFGFLITLDQPPLDLRDSPLLVPIAQALVALPLVVRTLAPVLGGIDDRQRQAAASLGASPCAPCSPSTCRWCGSRCSPRAASPSPCRWGSSARRRSSPATSSPTLPVVIFRLIGHPGEMNYGMALAASVVLAAATAVVMLAVERLRVPGVGAF